MNWLKHLFSNVANFFHSPALQSAEQEIEKLIPLAAPIVTEIAALTPNRTVQEIAAVYQKYAVPFTASILEDPNGAGNALLNLATTVMQKNHVPNAAVSLIQTVVQIAVLALKTKALPVA